MINLTREEAQQVLDGLDDYWVTTDEGKELVETLRAKLSEPEPEPIGYMDATMLKNWDALKGTEFECTERSYFPFSRTPFKIDNIDCCIPLYTTPPQREWKSLTDEEVFAVENSVPDEIITDRSWCIHFARAIEAKSKDKNS